MHTNWQVCSLIVQAKGEVLQDVSARLNAFPGCEVAVSDRESGQLIVVAEAEHSETLMQTIESVRNVAGVLAVSLVYHQQDEQGEETP
ncbi:chaperone NapD [Intestinirhabdus alba]|jgi:nitrate reductase NapD|uniref:Chaperone NapD n=1 Tax=Intestinirhabdus alba TaxID=2899544 RepID=A0A6L6IKR4_9ENTR|nr:chaperone NapD [Intestinirhabdus alba]MTH46467.1 chaperone NapD [Intestinirhabdus alba]